MCLGWEWERTVFWINRQYNKVNVKRTRIIKRKRFKILTSRGITNRKNKTYMFDFYLIFICNFLHKSSLNNKLKIDK